MTLQSGGGGSAMRVQLSDSDYGYVVLTVMAT
jgi:hypothetical protein